MIDKQRRIMRIPLPVPLIREMDAIILQEVGGYVTRAEFIVDAIQERILELTIGDEEDAGAPRPVNQAVEQAEQDEVVASGVSAMASGAMTPMHPLLAQTRIQVPARGFAIEDHPVRPDGVALFGLHNRDYPSLWALARLAVAAGDQPVPIESYYTQVLLDAWKFGALLLALEKQSGPKRTALFPTNIQKEKAAEAAFRTFAIGDYRTDSGQVPATHGPLFEWRVAAVKETSDGLQIGVTSEGWDLLGAIDGISVDEPHPPSIARSFFDHLARNSGADWEGFVEIFNAIGSEGANRQQVLKHFAEVWSDWTENEVSTNAAGYVARAREWGLLEPKQTEGRYQLTQLGLEQLTTNMTGAI
ncbi:MAG: hypothetical protein GXP36_09955 [Actinobacteria bacterium]|nr:hypothetical protein [Actinomycetota bacterium]